MVQSPGRAARLRRPATIGIALSKASLDVPQYPEGLRQRFTNASAGHAFLVSRAASRYPGQVIFEATGACSRALETALGQAGLPLVKINPVLARRFARAFSTRLKTDPVGAAMLARMAACLAGLAPLTRQSGQWRGKAFFPGRRTTLQQAIYMPARR